jgi:hypothetical protein
MSNLRNRLILVATLTLLFSLQPFQSLLELVELSKNHFNMITFNSIFAGFNFTTLIALLSLTNTRIIKTNTILGDFEKSTNSIISGIYISTGAILTSFFNQIFIRDFYKGLFLSLEISFSIISMLSFILTLLYIKRLINAFIMNIKSEHERRERIRKETAIRNLEHK